MYVRKHLAISWFILIIGLILSSQLDDNWPMIILGVFGGLAVFYRSLVPIPKSNRLGEYLNHHPTIKWFTAIYSLLMAGCALAFMEQLSELLMKTNIGLLVSILFLPFIIIWVKQDYTLYINGK